MQPDQRVKYFVPVAMVVVAVVGWVVLTATNMIIGGETSLGLAWLWALQVTPALFLMAVVLAAIFMVHDIIKTKKPSKPTS